MAQKNKPAASENERYELSEEEETVLLGWNRQRRKAAPSGAVFPYLFMVYICYGGTQHCVACTKVLRIKVGG